MTPSTQLDHRAEALRLQIEQIKRARRHLERSVDASGIRVDRAVDWKRWPQATKTRSNVHRRVTLPLLLLAVVALAAIAQLQRAPVNPPRTNVAAESMTPTEPSASNRAEVSVGRITTDHPLVIHIRAIRECRIRASVDDTLLEWRPLRRGDEFFSRPRDQLLIESDDGGALSTTVNGVPVSLGPDGHATAVRLTTKRPYPERISPPRP